jgi:hypothetical protein
MGETTAAGRLCNSKNRFVPFAGIRRIRKSTKKSLFSKSRKLPRTTVLLQRIRVARCYIFITKSHFWYLLEDFGMKNWWYILWPFGVLWHFVGIWYDYFPFRYVVPTKKNVANMWQKTCGNHVANMWQKTFGKNVATMLGIRTFSLEKN